MGRQAQGSWERKGESRACLVQTCSETGRTACQLWRRRQAMAKRGSSCILHCIVRCSQVTPGAIPDTWIANIAAVASDSPGIRAGSLV